MYLDFIKHVLLLMRYGLKCKVPELQLFTLSFFQVSNPVLLQEKCIVSSSEDEFPKAMFAFHFQFPSGHKSGEKWNGKELESVLLKILKSTLSDIKKENIEDIKISFVFREIISWMMMQLPPITTYKVIELWHIMYVRTKIYS